MRWGWAVVAVSSACLAGILGLEVLFAGAPPAARAGQLAAAAAGLGTSAVFLLLCRSLPQVSGRRPVPGLADPAEIVRDDHGVPHVFAASRTDAYTGLGLAHAQDRLWQMEFQRRIAYGRMAEIMGDRALPLDRFMRTLGINRVAEPTWECLPPRTRRVVEAYVRGINAHVSGLPMRRRPPEFLFFRVAPEPWSPVDVVAASKLVAWNLGGTYVTELLRRDLRRAVGPDRARRLLPDPGDLSEGAAGPPGRRPFRPGDGAREAPGGGGGPAPGTPAAGGAEAAGSNLWVVDGERCAGGSPVLASDPHLPSSVPSTWYFAHLSGGGLDAAGATLPGLPAVVIGRNRRGAWGVTNLNADVQDLYRERLGPDGRATEHPDGPRPVEVVTERIAVRGGEDVEWPVRRTRHGPLLSDVLEANHPEGDARGPLALRWVGLEEDDRSLTALVELAEAGSWRDVTEALKCHGSPGLNVGWADVDGHIGCRAAGRVPVRSSGDGSEPAAGWAGEGEWEGWVPYHELPEALDPPGGFLVSANGLPPAGRGPFLGRDRVEPYRRERVEERLTEEAPLTRDDHASVQLDVLSGYARRILPGMLELVPSSPARAPALALLSRWDRVADRGSAAAALFAAWSRELLQGLVAPELRGEVLQRYLSWTSYPHRYLLGIVTGDLAAPEDLEAELGAALDRAMADLRDRMGPDPEGWAWGAVHRAVFPHLPLHNLAPLRPLVSRTAAAGGDWSSVNVGTVQPGGAYRQRTVPGCRVILDLSGPDASRFVLAPGQAGHPLSPHYDDLLDDWRDGGYRPLLMDRAAVEDASSATLVLEPRAEAARSGSPRRRSARGPSPAPDAPVSSRSDAASSQIERRRT